MIDPRTTNIVGQHVLIMCRSTVAAERELLGRGIVRVVDYQGACFAFLIEAVGAIDNSRFHVNEGGLFEITTFDETVEVVVDHVKAESPMSTKHAFEEFLKRINHTCTLLESQLTELHGLCETTGSASHCRDLRDLSGHVMGLAIATSRLNGATDDNIKALLNLILKHEAKILTVAPLKDSSPAAPGEEWRTLARNIPMSAPMARLRAFFLEGNYYPDLWGPRTAIKEGLTAYGTGAALDARTRSVLENFVLQGVDPSKGPQMFLTALASDVAVLVVALEHNSLPRKVS